jgi:Na+-transporting NADH:ubiquinone oxidoreductase subunit NqrD
MMNYSGVAIAINQVISTSKNWNQCSRVLVLSSIRRIVRQFIISSILTRIMSVLSKSSWAKSKRLSVFSNNTNKDWLEVSLFLQAL